MPDLLPDGLRDRAARAGHGVIFCGEPADSEADISWQQWLAIVDAVAGVLAGHQGEADKAFNDLCHEYNDAQDELVILRAVVAELRGVVEASKALIGRWHIDVATYPDSEIGNAARVAVRLCGRELAEVLARSVSPDHTGEKP